jgi:hypothetical protein
MARNNNAFAKRQRDMQKKQKAQEKKERRVKRKEGAKDGTAGAPPDNDAPTDEPPSGDQ